MRTRKEMLDMVRTLQRKSCSYDIFPLADRPAPHMCDCKYGFDGNTIHGESTGCPEFRDIYHLLRVLSDDEFKELMMRV
jgi:hypothetical protein